METKEEVHADLLLKITRELSSKDFADVKYLCRSYLKVAELQDVTDFRELVYALETRGHEVSWKCGGYGKLVLLFKTANLPNIVKIIQECEREEVNKLADDLREANICGTSSFHTTRQNSLKEKHEDIIGFEKGPRLFIKSDERDGFQVQDETVHYLKQIQSPMVVAAVTGAYRGGKSFLLNKIANRGQGFHVSNEMDACTKGIWVWCLRHPEDSNIVLTLLDTEGLADPDKDEEKTDNQIMVLALLLSNVFIYNTRNTIERDAIMKLEFMADVTNYIQLKKIENNPDAEDYARVFPKLLWIVRDFTLTSTSHGQKLSHDEYLEKMLENSKGVKTEIKKQNDCKDAIREYFQDRQCFCFPFPLSIIDEERLANLHVLPKEQLNPEFLNMLEEVGKQIYTSPNKMLNEEVEINGEGLSQMATSFVKALRENKIPCVESAFESIADRINDSLQQKCMELYEENMKKKVAIFPDTWEEIEGYHKECKKDACGLYFKERVKINDVNAEIEDKIEESCSAMRKFAYQLSSKKCREILEAEYNKVQQKLFTNHYDNSKGYEQFCQDLLAIEKTYNGTCQKGVANSEILQMFLKSKETDREAIRQLQNKALETERAEQEQKKLNKKISEQTEETNRLQEELRRARRRRKKKPWWQIL